MSRIVVFVDYAGTCRSGHETFGEGSSPSHGPHPGVDPARLAEAVVRQDAYNRELAGTRVYCTVPDVRADPEGFSAALWEMERWTAAGVVVVRRSCAEVGERGGAERGAGGERSLAVALAVDLMLLAWRDEYDVAVVCSTDAALVPAVRAVLVQTWKSVEVAAWRSPRRPARRLTVAGETVRCHWLDVSTYQEVAR